MPQDRQYMQWNGERLESRLPESLQEWIGKNLVGGVVGCLKGKGCPIFYMNSCYHTQLGYAYGELMEASGGLFENTIMAEERQNVLRQVENAVQTEKPFSLEFRMPLKNGGFIWVRDTGGSVWDNGTQMVFHVCVDITELVLLREQLAEKSRQVNRLFDSLPCGICKLELDNALTILYANQYYYSTFGYTAEQAKAEGFQTVKFALYPADFPRTRRQIRENVRRGYYEFELEHRICDRTGGIRWVLSRCTFHPEEPNCLSCVLLDITDRKNMEEQLRISEEENRIAFSDSERLMDVYEIAGKTLLRPQKAAEIFGVPTVMENVPYSVVDQGVVAEESIGEYIRFYESMQMGAPRGELMVRMKTADGSFHWYAAKYTMIFSEEGTPQRAIISYDDVTERREKELAYQKWSQYFESQRENCVGYYEYNLTKDLFKQVLSPSIEIPVKLKTLREIAEFMAEHFVYEEDRTEYFSFLDRGTMLVQYYIGKRELSLEYRRKDMAGHPFWARSTVQLMSDPYSGDVMAFLLIRDIDAEKKEYLQLRRRVDSDGLTGLLNRDAFAERVAKILSESGRKEQHAFLMLDIDHFKQLNDSFGHQFGDHILREAAAAMKNTLRSGDLCGRLGGDEFVIFLRNIRSVEGTEGRLEQLRQLLNMSNDAGASVSVSIGLAAYPRDGITFTELYQRADLALYEAKEQGRNCYVIYQPGRLDCALTKAVNENDKASR